jgi:nucleoside-diphosphate-sugar epimerase
MRIVIIGASGFIGTNAIEAFTRWGHEVLNFDFQPPLNPEQRPFWRRVDIMDAEGLRQTLGEAQPDAVIHLAARTDCDENTTVEASYRQNTDGAENLLNAVKASPSVQRLIMTSSQFVCGPGYQPKHDEDFRPATVYGQSKVITEKKTRAAGLKCIWTLVRPTNIWGPWHQRYQREFWRVVSKGLYVHPGGEPVVRCYGYVGNVLHQMCRILELPRAIVHEQVFYLGDPPGDISGWVNGFSQALRGRPARIVPRFVLRSLGLVGDAISRLIGRPFLITSSRYRSMTSDYLVDMEKTFRVLGPPPISLEQGIAETVKWYRSTIARS